MADVNDAAESDEAFRKFKRWFLEDSDHLESWRDQAVEDYAFVAGEQWDDKDVQKLKDEFRPVITFNRIDPLIRSVSGEQINNAQRVRYIPREQGDVRPNEILTSAAEWFDDQCDADDEDSEAFWDAAVCGIGVTETRLDFESDPEEPAPVTERIDPLEMLWDASASKRNLSDARRIWRVRADMPIDEARERFPDFDDSDLDATWARMSGAGKKGDDSEPEYDDAKPSGEGSDDKDTVTIVQCQWWDRKTYYKVAVPPELSTLIQEVPPNGVMEMDADQFEASRANLEALSNGQFKFVRLTKRVHKQAFIGRTVLKTGDSPDPDRFTFNFMTGFRDRNNGHFYGLVRSMKDPQRWANKWLSQTLHIMNTNAKGGVMMEDGAVEDQLKFEESFAKVEAVTLVPPGTLAGPNGPRIIPKPVATFPAGFHALMEYAISSIRDVSGINLEMLGMREAGQAASLEFQRRQAGITILAPLFRSMRRYHRNRGRVMLHYIQNYLSDERLIRIVGDDGAKYVPLAKQAAAKYDIIVDEGPTSPNQKERVWSLIGQRFFDLPPQIQVELLEYSPFPASVVEKVKQAFKSASEGPQAEMAQKMAQLEAMLAEAKVMLTQAQAKKAGADAMKTVSEIGRPTGVDGRADKGIDVAVEKYKTDSKARTERERMAHEANMHREGLMANAVMADTKAESDMQTKVATAVLGPLMKPEPEPAMPGQPYQG